MSALGMMIPLSLYVSSWFAGQYFLTSPIDNAAITRAKTFGTPRRSGKPLNQLQPVKTTPETHPKLEHAQQVIPAGAVAPNGAGKSKSTRVAGRITQFAKT